MKMGIDPAFRANGFGVVVIDDGCVYGHQIKDFFAFVDFCINSAWPDDLQIIIENSNLQNVTYDLSGTKGVVARKSRNVGANQAASQYTVDFCKHAFGEDCVFEVSPRHKGAKWSMEQFQRVVKDKGHKLIGQRWGQDKRDAYKLAIMKIV